MCIRDRKNTFSRKPREYTTLVFDLDTGTHPSIWGSTVPGGRGSGAEDRREWDRLLARTVSCLPEEKREVNKHIWKSTVRVDGVTKVSGPNQALP